MTLTQDDLLAFASFVSEIYHSAAGQPDRPPLPREERRVVTGPRPSRRAALAEQAALEHAPLLAQPALQVWVSTDHDVAYPVGGASVVVAHSEMEARVVLSAALVEHGLSADGFTLQPLPLDQVQALVLRDGDY